MFFCKLLTLKKLIYSLFLTHSTLRIHKLEQCVKLYSNLHLFSGVTFEEMAILPKLLAQIMKTELKVWTQVI